MAQSTTAVTRRLDVTLVYGQDDAAEPGRVAVLQGGAGTVASADLAPLAVAHGRAGDGGLLLP